MMKWFDNSIYKYDFFLIIFEVKGGKWRISTFCWNRDHSHLFATEPHFHYNKFGKVKNKNSFLKVGVKRFRCCRETLRIFLYIFVQSLRWDPHHTFCVSSICDECTSYIFVKLLIQVVAILYWTNFHTHLELCHIRKGEKKF